MPLRYVKNICLIFNFKLISGKRNSWFINQEQVLINYMKLLIQLQNYQAEKSERPIKGIKTDEFDIPKKYGSPGKDKIKC